MGAFLFVAEGRLVTNPEPFLTDLDPSFRVVTTVLFLFAVSFVAMIFLSKSYDSKFLTKASRNGSTTEIPFRDKIGSRE